MVENKISPDDSFKVTCSKAGAQRSHDILEDFKATDELTMLLLSPWIW
jgi:hypothetical protein